MRRISTWTALAAVALILVGCTRPWNVAHEALEVLADATVTTDRIVREHMPTDYDDAEAAVLAQAVLDIEAYRACLEGGSADCTPPRSVDEYMVDWRQRTGPWREAFEVLEAMRDLLIGAEAILAAWRDTGEEPSNWSGICRAVGELQERITSAIEHLNALDGVDVELPTTWHQVRPMLEPVCTWIVGAVTAAEKESCHAQ